jgi:hypothetical protein
MNYVVIVNGIQTRQISPTRGIRQGDPISPYLFIICVVAFNSLLSRADDTKNLTSVPTFKKGPLLNHIFFFFLANDSLIFCNTNPYIGAS